MLGQLCGCFKGSGPHAAASSSVPQVGSAATPASSTQQAGSSTALATKDASSPSHAVQAASSSTQGDSASAAATPEQLACSLQYVLQQPADKQFEALQEQEVVNKLDQVLQSLEDASYASGASESAGQAADTVKAWGEAASAAAKGFQDAVKDVKDGVYGVDWAALGATGEKLLCAGSGAAYVGPVFALMAFALKQWSAFEQVPSEAFALMRCCRDLLSDLVRAYPSITTDDAQARLQAAVKDVAQQLSDTIVVREGSLITRFFTAQVQVADLSKATDDLTRMRISLNTLLLLEVQMVLAELLPADVQRKQLEIGQVFGLQQQEAQLAAELLVPGLQLKGLWLHGMGGSGKSTLAKTLYNLLADGGTHLPGFKHRAFIGVQPEDRDEHLTKLLIRALRQLDVPSFSDDADVSELRTVLTDFCRNNAVLLVVDNVWTDTQLDTLLPRVFGANSRFIVTSRLENMSSNSRIYQALEDVIHIHDMQLLDTTAAKEMFCHWSNTTRASLPGVLAPLLTNIIAVCGGLPLALELAGGMLRNKNNATDYKIWEAVLKALKEGSQLAVQSSDDRLKGVLQASFDSLIEPQQNMFLDIVSVLGSNYSKQALEIWGALWPDEADVEGHLEQLQRHALVSIATEEDWAYFPPREVQVLLIHDVVRSLGRGILRMSGGPFYGSRVWVQEDGTLPGFTTASVQPLVALDLKAASHMTTQHPSWTELMRRDMQQLRFLFALDFPSLINRLHQLTSLRVLDVESVFELPADIGALQELQLLRVSWSGFSSLPDSLGQLTALTGLYLRECNDLTCLPSSLVKLESLEVLEFVKCTQLTALVPEDVQPDSWQLRKLQQLNLSGCESLHRLPAALGMCMALSSIDLQGCKSLGRLPATLTQLSRLEVLTLERCTTVRTLPPGIGALTALKTLNLREIQYTDLPESISQLSHLEELILRGCRMITALPPGIEALTALKLLDISDCNSLTTLPSLSQLPALTKVQLQGCGLLNRRPQVLLELPASQRLPSLLLERMGLSRLPEAFGQIPALQELEDLYVMECEQLEELPESLTELTRLTRLDLSWCDKLRVPESIGKLTALRRLELFAMPQLKTLPATIWELTALTYLSLERCVNLVLVPADPLGQLTALKEVRMEWCESLSCLPDSIGDLAALRELSLCKCFQLKSLPNSLGKLSALSELGVSRCSGLSCLPESVGELSTLQQLNLRGCSQLSSLPASLGNLSLTKLILADCSSLSCLPDDIGDLSALQTLALGGCSQLSTLPASVTKLTALRMLNLSGCEQLQPEEVRQWHMSHEAAMAAARAVVSHGTHAAASVGQVDDSA